MEPVSVRTIPFDYLVGGEPVGLAQLLDDNRLITDFGPDSVVFEVISKFVQVLLPTVVVRAGAIVVLVSGLGFGFAVVALVSVVGSFALGVGFGRLLVRSRVAFGQ